MLRPKCAVTHAVGFTSAPYRAIKNRQDPRHCKVILHDLIDRQNRGAVARIRRVARPRYPSVRRTYPMIAQTAVRSRAGAMAPGRKNIWEITSETILPNRWCNHGPTHDPTHGT